MKNFQSLKGRKIFLEVLRKGRRFYGKEIQLIIYSNNRTEGFFYNDNAPVTNFLRLGIQVDKRNGNSVKRNLAKRRIRTVCSEILRGLVPLKTGENLFVIIRPLEAFQKLKYEEIKKLIALSFNKAGISGSARL